MRTTILALYAFIITAIAAPNVWAGCYSDIDCGIGEHCVKSTWVKGHATTTHVSLGLLTDQERVGNHEADTLATRGRDQHKIPIKVKIRIDTRKIVTMIIPKMATMIVMGRQNHRREL